MIDVLRQLQQVPAARPTSPTDIAETGQPLWPGQAANEHDDEAPAAASVADEPLLEELARQPKVREYLGDRLDDDELR